MELAHSLWMRAITFACLLLVTAASSLQAVHIHGQWLPRRAAHLTALPDGSQVPGGEENCPLCMAMHTAMPAAARIELPHPELVECKEMQAKDHLPETLWHYATYSKPPPEQTL
ncbi:MAG: hypothetical protein ACLGQX_05575 [Acidobacteriota bacterium]|jgi:type II secretory pathway component PulL